MIAAEKIQSKERLLELVDTRGFIINIDINENKIHTPDCYFVGSMNPEKKEGGIYYSSEINELISHFNGSSFYKCFYCDPILDTTEIEGKSIEILEKETKGLPMWNLVMPPAWEQYYIKKAGRILSAKKERRRIDERLQ